MTHDYATIDEWLPRASVESHDLMHALFAGYPAKGSPGVSYGPGIRTIDSRLTILNEVFFRDAAGQLVGVLRHYPNGHSVAGVTKVRGEFAIAVRQHKRRQGIASELLKAAEAKWHMDYGVQSYTTEGRALVLNAVGRRARQLVH